MSEPLVKLNIKLRVWIGAFSVPKRAIAYLLLNHLSPGIAFALLFLFILSSTMISDYIIHLSWKTGHLTFQKESSSIVCIR